MTKHTVEIEGLPEGWEPVAYRKPVKGEYFLSTIGTIETARRDYAMRYLIIKKPSRAR